MPIALDHVFAVVLAVLFPVRAAWFGYRRLTHATPEEVPRVRLWLYRQGITLQWGLTLACLALWIGLGRPWASLGVVPRWTVALPAVAVAFAILVIVVMRQRQAAMDDDDTLARLRHQMRVFERLLPRSERELRWFTWLSITAGICEELLYRGYLIWYFATWLGIVPAVAVASVIFGLGHAYQGPRGIVLTTLVGLVMSAVYLLTGSLWMSVVMHTLMDIHSGQVARAAFARDPFANAIQVPAAAPGPTAPGTPPPVGAPAPDAPDAAPGAVTADDPEG